MNINLPILYVDMDDTINLYTTHFIKLREHQNHFPQAKEGFYIDIPPNEDAIKYVKLLSSIYDIYFLTAPSLKNPHSYSEKRLWIEKYFGFDWVTKLIICNHKNLLMGDYLIDDLDCGKGQEGFTGELIQYTSSKFPTWEVIYEYLTKKQQQIKDYEKLENEVISMLFPDGWLNS